MDIDAGGHLHGIDIDEGIYMASVIVGQGNFDLRHGGC